jgi:carbon-monoxide dehydrogenase medium subunit
MNPYAFDLITAESVEHAVDLLATSGDEVKVLAGGQSLGPMLNYQLIRPSVLVDIKRVQSLYYELLEGDTLRLGALTREVTLEKSPLIRQNAPLLGRASELVAHPAVRERGTLAGSVAHNDPAGEFPSILLALNATVSVTSSRGTRNLSADELITGRIMDTSLEADELITEIQVPVSRSRSGSAILEIAERKGDYATAGAIAVVTLDEFGRFESAALCGLAGLYPLRLQEAESLLVGESPGPDLYRACVEAAMRQYPSGDDIHASAGFRRTLFGTLLVRAVKAAVSEALVA